MKQQFSIIEAQANFPQIINETENTGQETVIQRGNQPIVVLISYEQYQELLALRQAARVREARFAVYDEIRARNLEATPKQVVTDVAEAVAVVAAISTP